MNFQYTVITVAICLLILSLGFIGYILYSHQFNSQFPPVVADCPDFWSMKDKQCYNNKNLGTCKGPMNFNDNRFKGNDGDCNKAKWAYSCNVSWSGITNNSNVCENLNDE